jgi:hypothetical protein
MTEDAFFFVLFFIIVFTGTQHKTLLLIQDREGASKVFFEKKGQRDGAG